MIAFSKFAKSFGRTDIIKPCDFSFSDNEISFLMAPNGSGKTTLIKCMCGLEKYSGEILVDGKSKLKRRAEEF